MRAISLREGTCKNFDFTCSTFPGSRWFSGFPLYWWDMYKLVPWRASWLLVSKCWSNWSTSLYHKGPFCSWEIPTFKYPSLGTPCGSKKKILKNHRPSYAINWHHESRWWWWSLLWNLIVLFMSKRLSLARNNKTQGWASGKVRCFFLDGVCHGIVLGWLVATKKHHKI